VLCFDEFQVTDIADAIIMTKLFGELWKRGTILVATSNCPPDNLYEDGLNRDYFLPFIKMLKQQCQTFELSSATDYRLLSSAEDSSIVSNITSLTKESSSILWEMFKDIETNDKDKIFNSVPSEMSVSISEGRSIIVSAIGNKCWISFSSLCDENRGPSDYRTLCKHFNCIYVEGVRKFSLLVCYSFTLTLRCYLIIFHQYCRKEM
jgi:predicted ATPase